MPYADDDIDELRTRADWYTQLLATTRDAVVCIDRHGRIVLFNQAAEQMFGYAAEDVLGKDVKLLMPEPYASEHGAYVTRYEQSRVPRAIGRIRSVAARRASGEVFPIELSVTEVELGERARYGAFIRDVSEKIGLQERLLERERLAAIGTTAASFAHEIGNPLNSMYMQAQLLKRRLAQVSGLEPRIPQIVDILLSENVRLSQLLHDFRSVVRRNALQRAPTDMNALLEELFALKQPLLDMGGIEVVREIPAGLPTVMGDAAKLKQVFMNLIKNAVEAMPDGGRLTVHAEVEDQRLVIEVVDTGVGLPAGIDVFEPFQTTKPSGTGLGLSVARQVLAAHEGTIGCSSTPGGGTTFRVVLPLAASARERR